MKILVTGANGQLGCEIKEVAIYNPFFFKGGLHFVDLRDFDITNKSALENAIKEYRPELVMNFAAYTAVDKAETERDIAFAVNSTAVEHLAELSNQHQFFLLHISTDYVFDGKSHLPISEDHPMAPESYYGISKASGEVQMRRICRHGAIIRTSWLFSHYARNILKTVLELAIDKKEIKMVCDQIGTPTYAADLAQFIMCYFEKMMKIKGVETYHFSNSGVASWYDFAYTVVDLTDLACKVVPISTAEYPSAAPRPAYSVLSKQKILKTFKYVPRHWSAALFDCLNKFQEPETE